MCRSPLLIILFLSHLLSAQETGENKIGSWHAYFGTNKIADRWSVHTEIQLRYYEQAKTFNQSVIRTGINYHINSGSTATLGYTNLVTDGSFIETPDENNVREHHIFEQLILSNNIWKLNFQHRYRLEQRFIDFGDNSETQHRIRYRLKLLLPLSDIFFLNFYEEVFLNFQNNTFDQNWSYAALGFHVTDNFSAQVGYININTPNANFDRLSVAIVYNPDLGKLFQNHGPD